MQPPPGPKTRKRAQPVKAKADPAPAGPGCQRTATTIRECEVCGRQFTPARATTKYCGKKCSQKVANSNHYEKTKAEKNGAPLRKCGQCWRQFAHPDALAKHEATHGREGDD